jgi:hypothetical protein
MTRDDLSGFDGLPAPRRADGAFGDVAAESGTSAPVVIEPRAEPVERGVVERAQVAEVDRRGQTR